LSKITIERSEAYWKKRQECFEKGERRAIDRRDREIAIVALRKGYSPDAIMDLTGLSLEEIEELRESLEDG
jgi:hypothetical protein